MSRRMFEVDVFGTGAFTGNPVAVVLDGDGLVDEEMARIAHWLNYSETVFVLPPTDPTADYAVRIFTRASSCPSPGTRPSAPRTPGSRRAAVRRTTPWSRSAASGWSPSAGATTGSPSRRRR